MKPVLQALLLADRIYQDVSGKKIIAGTFDRLFFKRNLKPKETEVGGEKHLEIQGGMHPGSPYAFVSITEVRGTVNCVLQYVELANDKPLLQCKFVVQSDDPLKTLELIIPLPPLPIINAGVHALELLCDGEPIGAHRIHVQEMSDDRTN